MHPKSSFSTPLWMRRGLLWVWEISEYWNGENSHRKQEFPPLLGGLEEVWQQRGVPRWIWDFARLGFYGAAGHGTDGDARIFYPVGWKDNRTEQWGRSGLRRKNFHYYRDDHGNHVCSNLSEQPRPQSVLNTKLYLAVFLHILLFFYMPGWFSAHF